MDLYLIRHAIAEERSPNVQDEFRKLTEEGIRKFDQVVRGLREVGIRFEKLYHSPLVRAVQTAEMITDLTYEGTEVTPLLAASPTPALLEMMTGEDIGLVGHEPFLTELLAWLVVGDMDKNTCFELKKGGIAWLSGVPEPGAMVLKGLWTPKMLRHKKHRS